MGPQQQTDTAQEKRPPAKGGGRLQLALIILLALASVCFLAYPYVSNFLYHQAQMSVVHEQNEAVAQKSEADLSEEFAKADAYNDRLRGGLTRVNDPFSPTRIEGVGPEQYWHLLNISGNGVMGSVCMPRVGLEAPIYHGTADEALQHGAGHVENTSLPVGGKSTHAVLAGHNGLPNVQIFDNLSKAKKGDYFVITVLGRDLAYRVYSIETVLPEEVESLYVQEGKDLVTLVTCTPYGINSHRLLVHGKRCKVPQEWIDAHTDASGPVGSTGLPGWVYDWLPALAGLLVALVIIVVVILVRRRKRSHKD